MSITIKWHTDVTIPYQLQILQSLHPKLFWKANLVIIITGYVAGDYIGGFERVPWVIDKSYMHE